MLGFSKDYPKAFWVVWAVEFWERFAYYAMQALLALYFMHHLGFSQKTSFAVFGSFAAFAYGFVWIGGLIGDKYIGNKRALLIGAIVLVVSYLALVFSNDKTVFYALAGVIIGNSLFKANPSALIAKIYNEGDPALDGAITMYYMAVNAGAFISMAIAPILSASYGFRAAFLLAFAGLFIGIINYIIFFKYLDTIHTPLDDKPTDYKHLFIIVLVSILGIIILGSILTYTLLASTIVYIIVASLFIRFIWNALKLPGREKARMLIAFILILEAVVFFTLYNQMPTSLTTFALTNVNRDVSGTFLGYLFPNGIIPAAEFQVLNPIVIVISTFFLVSFYKRFPATHVTRFCTGMSLCALAFLVLFPARYFATDGLVSPLWLVVTYIFQSVGEIFISALGLAMIAELCPKEKSGELMGVWFLTTMLSGPLSALVANLTAPNINVKYSVIESLNVYTGVFLKIGICTAMIAIIMLLLRPSMNKFIKS